MHVPFSPPEITQDDINAVVDVMKSGWLTTGAVTQKFEDEIIRMTGAAGCICLSSATAALELTLRILDISRGDEVIIPAYTYAATANAVITVGATPVIVDCAPGSFNIDASAIEPYLTPKTKAIIAVDIGGVMCDYNGIINLAKSYKHFMPNNQTAERIGRIAVIADAAHSFGASFGEMSGSIADFTSFSFHVVKNLTTAEGGALCWRSIKGISNGEIDHFFRIWSLHGQNKSAFSKSEAGNWEYDIELPGSKCNMTDMQSAMGLSQLARYDKILQKRANACALYDSLLANTKLSCLNHFVPGRKSSYHLYMVRTGLPVQQRNQLITYLAKQDIAANVHFKPLYLFKAYASMGWNALNYPISMENYAGEVTLPLFNGITKEQIIYTANTFLKGLEEVR